MAFGVVFAIATTAACGPSQQDIGADSGDRTDAPTSTNDASADVIFKPGATWPTLVFVDGLVNGFATASNGTAITLDNVRVCLFDASKTALTKYALPDSTSMPLANYPGIRRGTGWDVGSFTVNGTVDVAVFPAFELRTDSSSSPNRVAYACAAMTCDSGPLCQPHVNLSVDLVEDVNVVGLVDTKAGGVALVQSTFEDKPFSGAPGSLSAGVIDFSGWHADSNSIGAFYGNYVDGAGAVNVALANPLTPNVATPPLTIDQNVTGATYDALGIRFDQFNGQQVADRFGQSLDSIAFLSNPTLDPPTFYGVRQNFIFALVGDPTDVTSVTSQNGRDWQFKGTGLHVTAVPYATPVPQ